PHHTEFILEVLDDPTYRPIEGLKITLHMKRLGKVSQGSPIYYRGIQVGQIEATRLSDTAQRAELDAVIFKKYASLVRQGSQFWNVSGIETSLSLLGGLRLNTTSFKSVLEGALAFATPEQSSPRANHGSLFNVAEKPEKRWLQWEPNIDFDSSGAKSLQ
ncbi:MAG: MlaD family protein, partial [Verrucomicrobiota bacterium]